MRRLAGAALLAAMAVMEVRPAAASVITALPHPATNDWTRGAMSPGNTGYTPSGDVGMETSAYAGNWFGWGTSYANTPDWTLGSAGEGNYLSLNAAFVPKDGQPSQDWTAYLYDGQYGFEMRFNPTNCDYHVQACYDVPHQSGVRLRFASDALPTEYEDVFVDLDTSGFNTYEVLVKDGLVSYRINGVAYTGAAWQAPAGKLLVIGDESGGTPTGLGAMLIHSILLDTAPEANVLSSAVPEPATWAMMLGGFGLVGAALRSRRRPLLAQ